MQFEEHIQQMKDHIDLSLLELIEGKKPDSLYDPIRYIIEAGGKRLRPFLVQLSCQAVGGDAKDSYHAALAVELLHTFTLVHDDIMDHDDLRRGRPTVHEYWDEPTAILAGDGLVTLAYQTLLKTKHPALPEVLQLFTDGLLVLCEGQALDKEFEIIDHVTLLQYEDMIEKKTAKLIEVSCEMGALIGNATKEHQKAIQLFAYHLGRAFQIQDDLLDAVTDAAILGKPTGSDFLEKKKTYVTLHFMNHASQDGKATLEAIIEQKRLDQTSINQIRDLLNSTGTITRAIEAVRNDVSLALNQLESLPPSPAVKNLRLLAHKIESRLS